MSDFSQPKRGTHLALAYLHGGEVIYQPGETLQSRMLADFELFYMIEGRLNYIQNGTLYDVQPGGIILGRPGFHERYCWEADVSIRHAYFHFGIDTYPAEWPSPAEWPVMRSASSPVCASLFLHILQHIYEHNDWPTVRPEPRHCRLVEALIDTFMEDHGVEAISFERDRPEPVRRALMRMRHQIEENARQSLTLAEVTGRAHVSEKHLCRLFADSVGFSPMQTYLLMRLHIACPLLVRSSFNISEIAARCGFENPLYFSRQFAKVYGCPPSVYRERIRSGKPIPKKNLLPADMIPRRCW